MEARRTTDGRLGIHPAIRKVWLFESATTYLTLLVFTSIAEFALIRGMDAPWHFPILMPVLWIGLGVWSVSWINRRWKAWGYEVTENEVIFTWGIWYQVQRFVPRDRVQHVDITSGPVARKFGLAHVHLYVAGAHGAVGAIPGLTPEKAEELRSMLVEAQAEHV